VGNEILEIKGKAASLLTAERTALNFLGHLSGIATHARKFADAVNGINIQLLDTRKTTPGLRILEKFAVLAGTMKNHRFGLYDQILIKENHLRASGLSISQSVTKCKNKYDFAVIGAEAETLAEFIEAMQSGVNYVLLDDFSTEDMKKAVEIRNKFAVETGNRIELEGSGGVTLENIREIAETGIDRISIGAVTHSSKRLDISCLFDFNTTKEGEIYD
jgi:nicotinate-nucleotide pyrophosphorylase (carboxylating)